MKKALKVISLFLALMLVFCLFAGCASDSSDKGSSDDNSDGGSNKSGGTIACLCPAISIDYYRQVFYGVIQRAEERGYDVQIVTGMTSIDDQVATIEDLVEAGVVGIVCSPMDSYGIASSMELCKERGVVFVSNDPVRGTDIIPDCTISSPNIDMGKAGAEGLAKSMNYKGDVIILRASEGVAVYDEKVDGQKEVFESYGMKVLTAMEAGQDQAKAQQVMADLIQQYPDADGVMCFNEVHMQGAIIALEEAGYEIGKDIQIASSNYSSEISDYIRDGVCSGALYSWGVLFGEWSVDAIDNVLNGEPVPTEIVQPYTFVDSSNIEQFHALSKIAHDFDFDKYVMG